MKRKGTSLQSKKIAAATAKSKRRGTEFTGESQRARVELPSGALLLLEESSELPLVDIHLTFRTGSVHDPDGKEGLTRLMGRIMRMGTASIDGPTLESTIARLGARLSIETSTSFIRVHGTVIQRNLEAFVDLVASLLSSPAFRSADVQQAKRETISDIIANRDNDRAIAGSHFRRFLFGEHPYGRPVGGTRATVKNLERRDIATNHAMHLVMPNLIAGFAGDIDLSEAQRLTDKYLGQLPARKASKDRLPAPTLPRGRRIRIINKPARTQTQLLIGTLGSKVSDPDVFPLMVGNAVFGGGFTSRLMREVRSVRGWSYGASSRIGQDRERDAWCMWTFPAAKDVVECAKLQLNMFEEFVEKGVTQDELRFTQNYLANSHCFDVDTAAKRLDGRVDVDLYGLPIDYYDRYVEKIREVTLDETNKAIRRRLSSRDMVIAVVATAKEVRAGLENLPGVESVEVISYDRD